MDQVVSSVHPLIIIVTTLLLLLKTGSSFGDFRFFSVFMVLILAIHTKFTTTTA